MEQSTLLLISSEEPFAVLTKQEREAGEVGVEFGKLVAGGADETAEGGCQQFRVVTIEPVAEEVEQLRELDGIAGVKADRGRATPVFRHGAHPRFS